MSGPGERLRRRPNVDAASDRETRENLRDGERRSRLVRNGVYDRHIDVKLTEISMKGVLLCKFKTIRKCDAL